MIEFDRIYPLLWQRELYMQEEKREHAFVYLQPRIVSILVMCCHILKARKETATKKRLPVTQTDE